MDTEVKVSLHTLKELRVSGKIAILRIARKCYKCAECGLPIGIRETHYCVYIGGAGLGNIKFPDRIHEDCINENLNIGGISKWNRKQR